MNMETRSTGKGKWVVFLRGDDGRVKFSDELRPAVEKDRDRFLEAVKQVLPSTDPEWVREKLLALVDRPAAPEGEPDDHVPPAPEDAPEDRKAALEALGSGDLMDSIRSDLSACGLATDLDVALLVYLAFTSRLLAEPVSLFMQGPSSSGKTFIGKVAAKLMPPEKVFDVQGITPKALYYMGRRTEHAVLCTGEWARDDDQSDNGTKTSALRQLMSDGNLSQLYVDTEGKIEAKQSDTKGPVAVYATSTLPMNRIFEEDENRFLFLHPDETEAATQRVMRRKAEEAAGVVQVHDEILAGIQRRHHAMQRELARTSAAVVVPFATQLADRFPSDQPRRRRDISKLLALVKATALLHQHQRRRDAEGRIVAEPRDYEVVHGLLAPFMVRDAATPAELRKAAMLREEFGSRTFRRKDAERVWKVKKAQAAESIRALFDTGQIENANGVKGVYQLASETAPLERRTLLPDVVAVSSCMECA